MDMLDFPDNTQGANEVRKYCRDLNKTTEEKWRENPRYATDDDSPIYNVQDIPKEMDIFFNSEEDFLPPGKTLKDLTPDELRLLKSQYRFSPFKPGVYQGITGVQGAE